MNQREKDRELERQILNHTDILIENIIAASMHTNEEQGKQLELAVETVVEMADLLEKYLGDYNEHFEALMHQLAQQKLPDENVLASFGDFQSLLEGVISKGLSVYHTNLQPEEDAEGTDEEPYELNDFHEEETQVIDYDRNSTEELEGSTETIIEETSDILEETELLPSENNEIGETTDSSSDVEGQEEERDPNLQMQDDKLKADSEDTSSSQEESPEVNELWKVALKQVFPDFELIEEFSISKGVFSYYIPELSLVIDSSDPDKKEKIWKEFFCRQNKLNYLKITTEQIYSPRHLMRKIKREIAKNKSIKFSEII